MDLLQHMGTFVRIADSGTISKAARSLHLSVAMASRHLRALEEHVGVELVRRTTRKLALTEAGTELLARARAILASVDEARDVVRPGRGAAGLLVISMPVTFGLAQISPLFHALLERHPRLKLDLRFEDRLVDLLGDGIDLAIRAGVPLPDSPFVIARRLTTVERLLCASPAFLAKHGRVTSMASLAGLPCVIQGAAPARWTFETSAGQSSVLVDGRVRTNNVIAIRDAALAGAGVARLPSWIIAEDLREKRLVRVLEDVKLQIIEVSGMYHHGSRGSSAIRSVLDFLEVELPRRMKGPASTPPRSRRPRAKRSDGPIARRS